MATLEAIGWMGGVFFTVSGFPQMVKSIREGHAHGLSWITLLCWLLGEICCFAYVLPMKLMPLIINYGANMVFLLVILKYKVKPNGIH